MALPVEPPREDDIHVRNVPLAVLSGTSRTIPWSTNDRLLQRAHAARHRLSLSALSKSFGELVRQLDLERSPEFNVIVHKKLLAALEYLIKTRLPSKGVIYNWVTPAGEKRTFWPAWTRGWAKPEWKGDERPPAGWTAPEWWTDTDLRNSLWKREQNGQAGVWEAGAEAGAEAAKDDPVRLTAEALCQFVFDGQERQQPHDQDAQRQLEVEPQRRDDPPRLPSSSSTGNIVPDDSLSVRGRHKPPRERQSGPVLNPPSQRAAAEIDPAKQVVLILEDLSSLEPLKSRAVQVLIAAEKVRGERQAWNARISTINRLLANAAVALKQRDDLRHALRVATEECIPLDQIHQQARGQMEELREMAGIVEGRVRRRLDEIEMAANGEMARKLGLGRGLLFDWDRDGGAQGAFGGWLREYADGGGE